MKYDEFIALVRELRDKQKRFFRGERALIGECKALESRVDAALKDGPQQEQLFGDED